jgi:hypothetical protein
MGSPVPEACSRLAAWFRRMTERPSVARATADAMTGFEQSSDISDPFFTNEKLHWRSDRIESLIRFGLGPWLLDELENERGFLPPM